MPTAHTASMPTARTASMPTAHTVSMSTARTVSMLTAHSMPTARKPACPQHTMQCALNYALIYARKLRYSQTNCVRRLVTAGHEVTLIEVTVIHGGVDRCRQTDRQNNL